MLGLAVHKFNMRYLLGIETSCDDTGAAVVSLAEDGLVQAISEVLSSQTDMHQLYGGVVPELAAREHLSSLPVVISQALDQAGLEIAQLSAIGVTRGPGLKGCLLVGLNFAKAFSLARQIPLIAVNHIEAHIYAAQLDNPELRPPFLALVVSGGHTEIHVVRALGQYELIARTVDDAAGEAFDKSANLLGFSYPGGAKLAALADTVAGSEFRLPRVMRKAEGFSFSGLKTAIALLVRQQGHQLSDQAAKASLAFAIQEAIVDALIFKLKQAVNRTGIRQIAVTGGVSANQFLRCRLSSWKQVQVYFPELKHCVDNGANTAYLAAKRFAAGETSDLAVTALARWPIESTTCG